jgi:long-subunit fatty acid transport protein
MMALMIVGLMAGSVAAQTDWEANSGLAITNVTLDAWNNKIEAANQVFSADPNGTEMEEIERVPMLYVEAKRPINDKWDAGLRFENIFGTVEGEANVPAFGGEQTGEIDVSMTGFVLLADYNLAERWSVGGGVGFYNGTKSKKFTGGAFASNPATPTDEEYDLDARSYRLGLNYNNSFAESWAFKGGMDYIVMDVDDSDPTETEDVESRGFSFNAGVTYSF